MESKHPHEVIPKIIKQRKWDSQIADTPFYQLSDRTNVFTLNLSIINGRTKPLHKCGFCAFEHAVTVSCLLSILTHEDFLILGLV
jgi:hypothetical protein